MNRQKTLQNKRYFFLVASLFFIALFFSESAVAEVITLGTFKQNTNIPLTQVCDNCTYVNLTQIQLPGNNGFLTLNALMTKNGQNYNYTFTSTDKLGDYIYTTCGDPDGVLTCESVGFKVTPSGSANILGLFIIVIATIYGIAFIGFFGRNEWISVLGGLGLITLGLFTLNNGIDIFRNTITDVFSWTTIGLGSFISLFTGVELINENL